MPRRMIRLGDYDRFASIVRAAGLYPRECAQFIWQIRGGRHIVNFYPATDRRGEKFYVLGDCEGSQGGTLEEAIEAVYPPRVTWDSINSRLAEVARRPGSLAEPTRPPSATGRPGRSRLTRKAK